MKVNLSKNYSSKEVAVVNNIIKAIFTVKSVDIASYSPERDIFISNSDSDSADFTLDVSKFLESNASYKGITFKNLANKIFNEYIDPRAVLSAYNNLPQITENTEVVKKEIDTEINKNADFELKNNNEDSLTEEVFYNDAPKKSFLRGAFGSGIKS